MRKFLVIGAILNLFFLSAYAQEDGNSLKGMSFKDRAFTGGNLGLSFGTITNIYLAPVLGYRVTPRMAAGVGVIYQYVKDTRYNPDLSYSSYGFNIFSRYAIYGPLFVQAEYEYLNYEYFPFIGSAETARTGFNSVFLGGGLAQPMGKNAAVILSAFYNVTYQGNSQPPPPYSSPWVVRVGITAGF